MRHRVKERKAPYRDLLISLVKHERITTTLSKAKASRPFIEKLVTVARKNDLSARRRLLKIAPQKEVVSKLLKEIGPRFTNRPGGYLRIVKLGPRPSDQAEMARLEWAEEKSKVKS